MALQDARTSVARCKTGTQPAALFSMRDGRIAVVAENDDDARELVVTAVEGLGFRVVEACSGDELLLRTYALLDRAQPIAIVISDIGMPGCDGIEATRRLLARAPSLPVVLMTAFGGLGVYQRAHQAGARQLLRKPFSLAALQDAVAAACTRAR